MSLESISDRLKNLGEHLTRSERLVADILFENYPASALGSITALADRAKVSTPTVARLVQKIGFEKYTHFQAAVRNELDKELTKQNGADYSWATQATDAQFVNEIAEAVFGNLRQTIEDIDVAEVEKICDLLAERTRSIFVAGGTITGSLANHLYVYLQVMRPGVHNLGITQSHWLHELMDAAEGDVLVVYHIRQYEKRVIKMAEFARERGAKVILVTDQWKSPISSIASHTLSGRLIMPSGLDSTLSLLLLNEIITSRVRQKLGDSSVERGRELEDVFEKAQWFK